MDKPYTIEELVEAAETVVNWYLELYEISDEMQNRLDDFFRWAHSKEPKNVKPLSMENYNEIPLDQKEALNKQVKELRKVFNGLKDSTLHSLLHSTTAVLQTL